MKAHAQEDFKGWRWFHWYFNSCEELRSFDDFDWCLPFSGWREAEWCVTLAPDDRLCFTIRAPIGSYNL